MRAAIIEEFGPVDTHNFGELPDPTPGPGEVLIDVHAIGVNFPDTLMVQGLYQVKPERPFAPGRDAAGVDLGRDTPRAGHRQGRLPAGLQDRLRAGLPVGLSVLFFIGTYLAMSMYMV